MTRNQSEELVDVTHNTQKPKDTINGIAGVTHARPPKPVPFGGGASDKSEQSREELRLALHKRRTSLTPQEHGFLEELVVHGNEIEVQLAKEKLCDEDLFFEYSDRADSPPASGAMNMSQLGWGSDIDIGSETTSLRSLTEFGDSFRSQSASAGVGAFHMSIRCGSPLVGARGSEKHQEHLEARRKGEWRRLWKAHATGLALTKMGSQRNLIQKKRRASLSGPSSDRRAELVRQSSVLSNATKELLLEGGPTHRPGEDAIFRGEGTNATKPSGTSSHSRSISLTKLPALKRPPRMRFRSEGSRKSVTFKEDHELYEISGIPGRVVGAHTRRGSEASEVSELTVRDPFSSTSTIPSIGRLDTIQSISAPSVPSMGQGRQVRSESLSSIPSIHHAHPIRSDSISSIPSLHHGNQVRADSISSIPLLRHGDPLRESSLSSIPSLHYAHHVHSESNMSLPSPASNATDASESLSSFRTDVLDGADAAWASSLPAKCDKAKVELLRHPQEAPVSPRKAVLYRQASQSLDNGQGIEVSEVDSLSEDQGETLSNARKFGSMVSFEDTSVTTAGLSASSFDEAMNRDSVFREIRTTLSDENLSNIFLGTSKAYFRDSVRSSDLRPDEERDDSWDMEDDEDNEGQHDAWEVLKEENTVDYGSMIPFLILGTSGDDEAATPHVLSPPLMESLQNFLPYAVSEDNFWMKYSLLRDGASLHTMLQQIRGAKCTVIAMETCDGEVFGSFTSEPWRKNWSYFGTGEAFLWRMRQSRRTFCSSIIDQAHLESELDVYPWTGDNECVQLCTSEMLAVGGGNRSPMKAKGEGADTEKGPEYGFGLTVDSDLLYGTSTHCATFASPPLSLEHADGSKFEIVNFEVWTMTPCMRLDDAEKLELGKLFLESG